VTGCKIGGPEDAKRGSPTTPTGSTPTRRLRIWLAPRWPRDWTPSAPTASGGSTAGAPRRPRFRCRTPMATVGCIARWGGSSTGTKKSGSPCPSPTRASRSSGSRRPGPCLQGAVRRPGSTAGSGNFRARSCVAASAGGPWRRWSRPRPRSPAGGTSFATTAAARAIGRGRPAPTTGACAPIRCMPRCGAWSLGCCPSLSACGRASKP
jgi:hypothetical protein